MTDRRRSPPPAGWRRPAPWLLAALVAASISVPGGLASAHLVRIAPTVGVARPLAASAAFSENLTDTPAFSNRTLKAVVGATSTLDVSISLDNTGSLNHTFTLVNANQSGVVLNRSWTPEQLGQYFQLNGTLVNQSLAPGGKATVAFTLSPAAVVRSFEFVSLVPYQFQAGMFGFLNLTPTGPNVTVNESTTNSLSFVPNALSAGPAVTNVVSMHVLVTNTGTTPHYFVVAAQPNTTLTSTSYFTSHPPLINVTINGSVGFSVWANFTITTAGVYEYVCTEPGHFASGMYGFLYVGVPVPSSSSPTTAIVEVPLLVGSVVLLGVGGALVAASAYRGRFPPRSSAAAKHSE